MTSHSRNIVDLYRRHGVQWDKDRGRGLFERPWLDRFVGLAHPGASILDIGCGGAEPMARSLIESGYKVTGADSSPPLIALCRERFPAHTWIEADMRDLALGQRFDGILAWDSFFHLCPEDQRAMFGIFRAHAAPFAALMFTSGPAHGEAIGSYGGEPLYHASLDAAEYRALLGQHGFNVVAHAVEDPTCGGHTIWLAQSR
jgi:2-polyprenyl-3-methyl-5-hydroxy-6-metoxy-1,4-benzoquinol methylase